MNNSAIFIILHICLRLGCGLFCLAIFSLYSEMRENLKLNDLFTFLMRQDSEWAPYISRLPQLEEMHNTVIFFSYKFMNVSFL